MAEKVRDRLRELTAYLESEHAVDSVEESVEHLQLAVADAMARSRGLAQQCTILLFQSHEPPSLMEFLDQSGRMSEDLRKREISHARIKVLELLVGFVKTYSQHAAVARTHIVNTMKRCQAIARSDWSNKVRSDALKVVIHVLKYATSHISSADVEPVAYMEKIVYDLKFGKASQTAKGTMLEVVGHLTAVFPDEVKTVALPLIAWIEDQLEKQFAAASPETLLVAGLLIALARLVVFDPSRYKEDATKRQQVYSYLTRILATTVEGQLSRYNVTKASLQFLEEHGQTFIDELGENGYTWFTYMRYCAASESKTIKENALACANNVLAVIGEFLVQTQEESRKKTLNRVLKEILPVLNDKSADTSTMAFALRCLARIAPAIRMYLGEKAFLKVEDRLRKFGENLLVLDDKATAMRWSVFSSYVECVGCFVKQERSTSIDDTNITFLGDLICHLLDAYPRCLWKSKLTIYKSILSILCAVHSSGDVQLLLDRIVHRAFLLSISNVTETEELMVLYHPETGNIETKLLYEYEDLWVALLRGKKHTKYKTKREVTPHTSSDTRSEDWTTITAIRGMLLDSLFKSVQAVVGGLNLAYQYDLQDGAAQGGGYMPNVARDHSIMLNMTEFIERVLPRLSPESLRAWIPILLMLVIEKSDELPLVSGFYRIVRVLTTVSEKTKYFDEMRDTTDGGSDVRVRRKYFIFAKRVIQGIRFYKDELLVASSGIRKVSCGMPVLINRSIRLRDKGGGLLVSGEVSGSLKLLDKFKSFCADVAERRSSLATSLRKRGDSITSKLLKTIQDDSAESSESPTVRIDRQLLSLRLVNELVVCDVVELSKLTPHVDNFVSLATRALGGASVDPNDRILALEAIKAGCFGGWDMTRVFDDRDLRRKLSSIYRDIILLLPHRHIWSRVAKLLITDDITTQRLVGLVELLTEVASLKVHPAGSSEMDNFVEDFLPHLKSMIGKMADEGNDAQRTRLCLESIRQTVDIFKHCSRRMADVLDLGPFPDMRDATITVLKRREISSSAKGDCLSILAGLGTALSAEGIKQIAEVLAAFVVDEFPISSADVHRGTRDYEVFQLLMDKLLLVVEECRSVELLKVLYSSLKEGSKHLFGKTIQSSLGRLATNVTGSSGPRFAHDYMMELLEVLLDPVGDLTVRRMLLENLFVPLAELQKADNLREFYMLEDKTSKVTMISKLATVVSNSSDVASQGAISTAAVAYTLVELLYRLVDPESIRGEINRAFLGHDNGKGRELTMLVCKCASKFITKTHDGLGETTRFSCSQAYNCLLTAVSRTQKQEKFYDQILFQEALWKNIIDGAREISLKAETKAFDRVPLSSFSARTLRNQQEQQTQGGTQSTSSHTGKRNSSTALQFFTASSLSQTTMTSEGIGSLQLDAELVAREAIYQGIDIELDSINDHPCMIPLLRVLLQMKTDFADSWDGKTMPGWMQKIYNVTADSTTEVGVRLFLVKIVLNVPDVFAKYADKWAEKLMEVIIEATMVSSSDKKAEFNYMIRDCCHLLADEWKNVSVGSCSMMASRFVNHLINLSPNEESNFIMRDNIRAVSELIALWKDHVRIDRDEVVKLLFSSEDNNPKREAADRYTALQIVSTMLTAGLVEDILPDFDMSDGKTIEDGVLESLYHKRASIYTVAAEISGLLLKAKTGSKAQAFRDKLAEHITKYYSEEEFGRFLALLRSVSLHEPNVLDSTMLHRLSFVLPKVIAIEAWSQSAVHCLFLALNNEEVVNEIFTHCQQVLGRFVLHRSAVVQLTALQLIERLLDHLDTSVACRFIMREDQGGIDLFGDTVRERDTPVRRIFYDIAKKLYQKNLDEPLKDRLRLALLQGLADPDISIRTEVLTFCNGSELLPGSCRDRVLELYQSMYAPGVEDVWLLYATNTLMGLTRGSGSFDSLLFTNPLSDGEYRDAEIDAAWETKNETMTPLFSVEADKFSFSVATQMGSLTEASIQSQGQQWGSSTQSLDGLFDGGSASSSQLISSSQAFSGSSSSQFAASSQFDGSQPKGKRRRRFVKKQSTVFSSGEARGAKGADKRYFQERYALFKKTEEAILNRQRKARDQQVQMRRKYRVGEYPDIQIKLKDIIDPLMALCEMHDATSAIVMAEVMASVVATKSFDDEGTLRTLGARMESALTTGKSSLVFTSAVHLTYYSCIMRKKSAIQMLSISAKVVGDSSLASGSLHSGELILEEFLTRGVASSADVTAEAWDHLYKILATTQKSNLLTALASKCCVTDDSKLALEARLAGDLPGAIASYRKAESVLTSEWETEPDFAVAQAQFEANRCYWERLQCLETLNNWDKLQKELGSTEDGALWNEEPPYLEQGVKHSLHSTLALIEGPADPEGEDSEMISVLRFFLDDAHKEPKRWDLLQTNFGVELSLSSLVFGDANQARVFVEKLFSSFLARWNGTSRIANLTRLELMQTLSSAVELDDLLSISQKSVVKTESTTAMDSRYISFVEGWSRALPSQGEGSMALWSHFYLVQQVVRSFLLHSGSEDGLISDTVERVFNQEHAQLMLKYAQAAVANDLLAVASKYLKDYRELCNAENLPKVSVLMVDVFVSHVQKLAERQAQKSSSMASHGGLTSDAINTITRYYQTSTKMFDNTDILELMESLPLHDRVTMGSLEAKTFGQAAQFYMTADLDKSMTEEFFTRAIDVFQRSCRSIPGEITMVALSRESEQSFSRCRVTFIEYLIDILFSEKRAEWMTLVEQRTMLESLTENVLSGMVAGDQECSNYLPQLCELIPPFPVIVAKFEKRMLSEVPMWTCLRWTAQLLALVNGPIGKSIVRILEKMATEYPAALFYDFKVTCAGETKTDIRRLTTLLSNPVMEKFVAALRLIHHPELRFKEGLREVSKLLESGKASEAKAKMAHVWQDCFASEHPLLGGQIGHYNRDWAKRAKRDVEKMLGRDGSNVTAKSVNAAREWIMNHFSVMPGKFGITKDMKARIADFADWLDEFDHIKCRLELPGQYTSYWGKPDLSNHTYILSVGAQLGVLVSKQLPKQITFHCSNQKEYTFLVKGGEDLRLDQRIEQLFDVMNQILASHPRCRDRHLNTKTYKVIPMTTEIGMIEWLHNTSTLKGVIEKQLQVDLRCTELLSNKRAKLQLFNTIPAKNYETYLMKQRGGSFAAKVIAPSHKDVVANFEGAQALIPADLLRLQLLGLGSDFEEFVSIRDQFASSLGVFSACSYILGIGDRHLDNFLLDHQTGRVIGIDFGVSFGAGASVLPVPELIPFRFTRQMEAVLQPYDGSNLLIQDMQAVFEALREKKQVIESVMNVFLHEPLLDWQQSTTTHQREIFETNQEVTQEVEDVAMEVEEVVKPSKRQKRSTMTPSTSSSSSEGGQTATTLAWLPDVKVAIARRKLEGFSPRALLKEELAQNPHLGKQLKLFQALVDTANAQASTASSTTSGAMSSLAQAQDLLALASAPDILGRTFQGWMPWL
ncbi:hypothetical protein Poli38472_002234 [Pythium oligandrum]|uniref:Non-specific serine/threonine protein kinase n=1 Tax=Pythium oligandrum TaxID=41045 RepID=A0A8K1CIX1_PYTOL|nr:hypothetical protein Poli38472_002234 [Pythium oligandrum]|eukprot:TMW63293.1 hypothetical protein Poli38472_002234 [Pythium oligandrum]